MELLHYLWLFLLSKSLHHNFRNSHRKLEITSKSLQFLRVPAGNSVTFGHNNHNKPLQDPGGTERSIS